MLVDDYVMRQIRKIAELCAALARSGSAPGLEEEIADAYRALTGLSGDMVDMLDARSLSKLVADEEAKRALADLLDADATAAEHRGEVTKATLRRAKAAALREA